MADLLEVLYLSFGMFIATFLVGYLPTRLKTSQKIMNLIAIYGAGLLVGAALVVIIPEGMLILFSSLAETSLGNSAKGEHSVALISELGIESSHKSKLNLHVPGADSSIVNPHMTKYVGASLIVGFSIMLILD